MTKETLLLLALAAAPIACASAEPPPPPPLAPSAFVAYPAPTDKAEAAPAAPSAEDQKKAEAAKKLAADRAEMEASIKAEEARWTPALHAEAKKLAAGRPTLKSALGDALKSKVRKPGHAARDTYRHPLETLEFLGLKPNMTVLEWGPGEGWYTELLAPVLAAKGKLLVTSGDPNGPKDVRATFYAERTHRTLAVSPELFGKVEPVIVDGKQPKLPMEGTLDMVLLFRGMHGLHNSKTMGPALAEMFKALKPGGVLGVVQHRAKADAKPDEASKKGYLPEAYVIQEVEAAGFKLAGKSEVNANAKDTKDYAAGVWALPPTLENKETDRAKYEAIGESDRMTLKFVKPKKK